MCGNGKMEISIRKGEDALGSWARPFEDKLPYLAIDWDKWYEDSMMRVRLQMPSAGAVAAAAPTAR